MEELLKIGAAYIRVSDERQDEYSPDSQLKKIREFAAKEGTTIPDDYVFYDDGISGKSVEKRDEFNRMIALAKEKTRPFHRIYVWKFSRFARNQEESMVYKNLLRKKGVSVVSVSEPIPEGHFGSLIERIIEWTDEYYLVNLGAEVTRGMTEKASRGEPTCAPPYGYIIRDGKYYPDWESGAAKTVQEVFELYAEGKGQREIARLMGDRGVRTRMGNMPENRWVDYMLHNPCYIGKIRWSLDGERAVSRRDYENEHVMTVKGQHEPIISKELWERVQKRLCEQKERYGRYARREQPTDYMLKGLVRCSACGSTLTCNGTASGKEKTRCLQCHAYAKGSCNTSHSITMNKLEHALKKALKEAIEEKSFRIVPRETGKPESGSADYDRMISVEQKRLERARQAYLAEIDTIEQYAQNKKEITERIAELTARKNNIPRKEPDPATFAEKAATIAEFINREDVTERAKNEALRTIIEKIVYEKATGNLAIYFHEL